MGKGKLESKELEQLCGKGALGGAGRSKYCIWVRPPKGIADCKW